MDQLPCHIMVRLSMQFLQHFSNQSLPTPWAMNRNASSHQPGPMDSARSPPDIAMCVSLTKQSCTARLDNPCHVVGPCRSTMQQKQPRRLDIGPSESAPLTSDVSADTKFTASQHLTVRTLCTWNSSFLSTTQKKIFFCSTFVTSFVTPDHEGFSQPGTSWEKATLGSEPPSLLFLFFFFFFSFFSLFSSFSEAPVPLCNFGPKKHTTTQKPFLNPLKPS